MKKLLLIFFFCISAFGFRIEIIEPLPESWSSCPDQPITLTIAPDGFRTIEKTIPSSSTTTIYYDTLSAAWIPAIDIFYSGWGSYIFPGSSWIWDSHYSGAILNRCLTFRTIIETPPGAAIDSASVIMRCDNTASFYMNGEYVGADDDGATWIHSFDFDLLPFIHGGSDTLEIVACDLTGVAVGLNFVATVIYTEPCLLDVDSIELSVDGVGFTLGDSELQIVDSTYLLWTPAGEVFPDGDTVEVCLRRLWDTCGDNLESPFCWNFFVDYQPPSITNLFPPEGAVFSDPFSTISADLADFGSGLDTSSVVMTLNSALVEDFSLRRIGDTWRLEYIPDMPLSLSDSVFVCISASDTTDYCPDNYTTECWSFIGAQERFVWFPRLNGTRCDTVLVPLFLDDLEGSSISRIELEFTLDPTIITPLGISTSGSFIEGWSASYVEIESGRIHAVLSGTPPTGSGEGVLLYLSARVNCSALGGDYCPIDIDTIWFNSGNPSVSFESGFFAVNLKAEYFTCSIFLNRTAGPPSDDFVLTFGATTSGSVDFDPGFDVQYIPPPSWRVNGWFPLEDSDFPTITRLSRDIRHISPPEQWTLVTENEPWGIARWNPVSLPEGEFRINNIVDMKRDSACVFHRNDTLFIEWSLEDPVFSQVELNAGWNMISCPAIPTARIAAEVFNTALGVYRYATSEFRYLEANSILAGEGYWVWTSSPRVVEMAGIPVKRFSRRLYPGWNLVGAIDRTIPSTSLSTAPAGALAGDVYTYDGIGYTPADSIIPGKAYWVLAMFNSVLTIPSISDAKLIEPIEPDWCAVLTSGKDEIIMAYTKNAHSGWSAGDKAVPPLAPESSPQKIQLYFEGIFFTQKLSAGSWTLICRERSSASLQCPDNINIIVDGNRYSDGDEICFSEGQFTILSEVVLPSELAIVSSQPNPFNSKTTIIVNSPSKSSCRIEVFDILGKIAFSERAELNVGINRISWNGIDSRGEPMATGVYFIKITNDNSSSFAKITLLK